VKGKRGWEEGERGTTAHVRGRPEGERGGAVRERGAAAL